MLSKLLPNTLRPKISKRDVELIASIKALKTVRSVGGTVSIEAEDALEEMRQLQKNARKLVLSR